MIEGINFNVGPIEFLDLESRYGYDNAYAILRVLEQFEGVAESCVRDLSCNERLQNVFRMMTDNMRYETRH